MQNFNLELYECRNKILKFERRVFNKIYFEILTVAALITTLASINIFYRNTNIVHLRNTIITFQLRFRFRYDATLCQVIYPVKVATISQQWLMSLMRHRSQPPRLSLSLALSPARFRITLSTLNSFQRIRDTPFQFAQISYVQPPPTPLREERRRERREKGKVREVRGR